MNILVLGGAGFIGQHLVHQLLATRHNRVVVIDNLVTSKINLDDFAQYKNLFEFREGDIAEIDDRELLRMMNRSHLIYHLAGSVGVEHIDKDPSGTLFNNFALTSKLIPLFKKANKKVVFTSTSEVYGSTKLGSFHELDNASIGPTTKLRWGYASMKLTTEFLITASGFPHVITRLFNVVGPGQLGDYGMVLPRFVEAAKTDQPLLLYGGGGQVRCFCHVKDAVDALIGLPEKFDSGVFNIGNDVPTTIRNLAAMVVEMTNSESEILTIPYKEVFSEQHEDIRRRVPNIEKLKWAGYAPKHSLEDIIRDML